MADKSNKANQIETNNSQEYMEKLRKVQLDLLDEFVRICDNNNIPYFMIGGTLLGAVRHKGYIPWDDDIDIGMDREGYNKFLAVCKQELKDKYYIDDYSTNKNYLYAFGKVKAKGTIFLEEKFKKFKTRQGIYIDIFPFDNGDNTENIHLQKKQLSRWLTLLSIKLNMDYYRNSKVKKAIHKNLLHFMSVKAITKKINLTLLHCNNNKSKYIVAYGSPLYVDKSTYERKRVYPLTTLEFEGRILKAPHDYDYVLKVLYNDYMKLPPKSQRVTHNPLLVKFSDNTTYERLNNKMVKK